MPDSPRTRPRQPTRPTQPHSGQSLDPVVTRKGKGPGVGVLVLVGAGLLAFSYAFNLGGLQGFLDGLFSGLNANVRSHNNEVVGLVPKVLPYVGFAIGGVVVLIVLTMLGRAAESFSKPHKPKPAPVEKPKEPEAPRPAQEFIRPARLAIREQDLKPKAAPPTNEPPSSD
jgi:hypothetical protein